MNALSIIDKYYSQNVECRDILLKHSKSVANKALEIANNHPELNLDKEFLYEAAMLHDIGIIFTNAPGISCFGEHPYIRHGVLGSELLRNEGYPRHALVCERHTGAGITLQNIIDNNLPLPQKEMLPISLEEQVICFADKFFSKTKLDKEKDVEKARKSLMKFGDDGVERFDKWCQEFL